MAVALQKQTQQCANDLEGYLQRLPSTHGAARDECSLAVNSLKHLTKTLSCSDHGDSDLAVIPHLTDFLFHSIKKVIEQGPNVSSANELKHIGIQIVNINKTIDSLRKTSDRALKERKAELAQSAEEERYRKYFEEFQMRLDGATLRDQRRATFPIEPSVINWTEGVKFGSLECLWEKIPEIAGLSAGSVDWLSFKKYDGLIFEEKHVSETRLVLKALCDAWLFITDEQHYEVVDRPKLDVLRNMSRIILTLSIIKNGRQYLDRFLKKRWDDTYFPYLSLNDIFCTIGNSEMAKWFMSQQYRIEVRSWPDGAHLPCLEYEPLRLEFKEPLGQIGSYGSVDKVKDISDGKVYARKIQHASPGAHDNWQNEVNNLKLLSEGSAANHIVTFVKTYERVNEFGCLIHPAAKSNLSGLLMYYVKNGPDTQRPLRKILFRAFGCLSIGLWYMHEKAALRHRDIKPDNILYHEYTVLKDGRVEKEEFLWADFGLAYHFEPQGVTSTLNSIDIGTKEYAAPEVKKTKAHGRKTDIFSFGCTFLEILNALLVGSLDQSDARSILSYRDYSEKIGPIRKWIQDVKRTHSKEEHIVTILDLARRMIDEDPNRRPDISRVIRELLSADSSSREKLFCSKCSNRFKSGSDEDNLRTSIKPSIKERFFKTYT